MMTRRVADMRSARPSLAVPAAIILLALGSVSLARAQQARAPVAENGEREEKDGPVVVRTLGELVWRDAPSSAAFAPVYGEPTDSGPFTFRMRMPPDFHMRPHSHNTAEHITERSELWRICEDGSDLEAMVTETGRHAWPRWSPDGARRITVFPGHDFSPAWHPDATRLAAVGVDPDGARRLRILSREGDLLAEMVGALHRVTEPAWSPDGHNLAYAARRTEADAYDVYLEAAPADPGPPLFVAVTEGRIGGDGGASRGVGWADVDSDGDPDLVVSNTNGQWNAFYVKAPEGFRKESDPNVSPFGAVAAAAGSAEGVAWTDMDADGDLDLFVANWGGADQVNRLYRNTTSERTGRSWIGFRLRSERSNTHGWGAKVRAKAVIRGEPRWMTRWNLPTTGYGSQNQLLVHFGLDDAERVDSLVVRWPSGQEEEHTDLEARRYWSLLKGAAGTGSTGSRRTIRRPGRSLNRRSSPRRRISSQQSGCPSLVGRGSSTAWWLLYRRLS